MFFYGSCDWGEGWLLGKSFCSIITHMKFQIITSETSPGSAENPTLQRKMGHLSFTVNPDTSWRVEWKGNEPSTGGIFILQPFSTLFVVWWLVLFLVFQKEMVDKLGRFIFALQQIEFLYIDNIFALGNNHPYQVYLKRIARRAKYI